MPTSKKPLRDPEALEPRSFHLGPSDYAALKRYEVLAEGISRIFGNHCEVVLHSLKDLSSSIMAIYNSQVTGRAVGSPVTDLALEILDKSLGSEEDVIGPYFSRTDSGKPLKSVTVLIRNERRAPIGFLCINFDISVPFSDLMKTFAPGPDSAGERGEHFVSDVAALIRGAVEDERRELVRVDGTSQSERNRRLILALEQRGLFGIKGAVENAARELGVTKFTIYKYLREIREEA